MITLLIWIAVFALICQASIGFAFFFYSIIEKEKRATILAAVQFVGMALLVLIFIYIVRQGYFYTDNGKIILTCAMLLYFLSLYFLARKTGPNSRAIEGAQGYVVGDTKRVDERDITFDAIDCRQGQESMSFFTKNIRS